VKRSRTWSAMTKGKDGLAFYKFLPLATTLYGSTHINCSEVSGVVEHDPDLWTRLARLGRKAILNMFVVIHADNGPIVNASTACLSSWYSIRGGPLGCSRN
jgi:hypothetical protein